MTTKRCGSAPHDGSDHFELLNPEIMFVDEVVGLSTENIGHLEGGPAHWLFLGRRLGSSPSPEIGRASMGLFIDCR